MRGKVAGWRLIGLPPASGDIRVPARDHEEPAAVVNFNASAIDATTGQYGGRDDMNPSAGETHLSVRVKLVDHLRCRACKFFVLEDIIQVDATVRVILAEDKADAANGILRVVVVRDMVMACLDKGSPAIRVGSACWATSMRADWYLAEFSVRSRGSVEADPLTALSQLVGDVVRGRTTG
jgi:hypothetical protein